MQERIQHLENRNASYKSAVATLETDKNRTRRDYEEAKHRVISLEAQLERQASNGLSSSGREKIQKALEKERKEWMQKQTQLKARVEQLEREISFQNIRCKRLEDERDEAIKSLGKEMQKNEKLKEANTELKERLRKGKSDDGKWMKSKRVVKDLRADDSLSIEDLDEVSLRFLYKKNNS